MILDKVENIGRYRGISDYLDKAINDVEINLEENVNLGSIKKNFIEFVTVKELDKDFENHFKYYDLHIVLEAEEYFQLIDFDRLTDLSSWCEEEDIIFGKSKSVDCQGVLKKGDFLICFKDEAHKLGFNNKEQIKIKKIVYKIPIGENKEEK